MFSHRTNLVEEPEFQKKLKSIEEDKVWKELFGSEPAPYLPGNEELSGQVNVI